MKQKSSGRPPAKVRQLQKDFRRLHALYTQILISESFGAGQEERKVEFIVYDGNITCSYCRGNIFNRFLTCPSCVGELPNGDEDTYDICMECYAMGRSCRCISKLRWVEQFSWGDLTQKHEQWRRQIIHCEGQVTEKSPKSLKVEIERYSRRTLAEICQVELKKRPWKDIKKPAAPVDQGHESEEVEVNGEGIVPKKKRKPRQSEKFKREHKVCHFHTTWEPKWKQIECSQCDASFCFGTLARAFDMKPQDILAEKEWKCPRCRHFCICRRCRDKPGWKMIEPPRTMLGHDTRKVADPRSVESLVDYSQSNISWLQKVGDDGMKDTRRLQKSKQAAERAKAQVPELGDDYVDTNMRDHDNDAVEESLLRLAEHEGIPIDPDLENRGEEEMRDAESPNEDEKYNENPEEAGLEEAYDSYHRGPPQPQHVIPAGGIIRDAEHAYDATEAITFDYPDPEFEMQVPQSEEQRPSNVPAPPGYEKAVLPEEPAGIEMIRRKRKRSDVEHGEEPYQFKKKIKDTGSKKKKPRKSLVVKLNLDKSKLAELNKMAIIAQRALNGVEEDETPVIGSDLRALNAESGAANAQQPPKKVRVEREDEDDDFTGPRIRKDRPQSTLESLTVPARRTRTQNVAYDEPSEEEGLEEILSGGQSARRRSQPPQNNTGEQSQSSSSIPAEAEGTDASSPVELNIDPAEGEEPVAVSRPQATIQIASAVSNKIDGIRSFADMNDDDTSVGETIIPIVINDGMINPVPQTQPGVLGTSKAHADSVETSSIPPLATAPPTKSTQKHKTQQQRMSDVSEAEKNRRAKLAAMHWAEGESDDFEGETSSASGEDLFIPRVDGSGEDGPRRGAGHKANAADWKERDSSDEETIQIHVKPPTLSVTSVQTKRVPGGLKPAASRRGRPRRSGRLI